jgi:ABC-type glutathione transport system ATPase component
MDYRNYDNSALLITESALDYHDPALVAEICDRAGLLEEYKSSDGETFESVLDRALEILKEGL